MKGKFDQAHLEELLYQAIETEQGGIKIYTAAIECAINAELHKEWEEYLGQTRNHERVLRDVFDKLGLDPKKETPGRKVVGHLGASLLKAIDMASKAGDPAAAQLVAAECVVLAETKDHQNWELLAQTAEHASGDVAKALKAAVEEVENEEDRHLYHTKGWARELWIASLGMPAVLPPPEEVKDVDTAIGASRAEQSREKML
ncbi:MAG TPA: hypothetical protein VFB32_13035 [Rudaea sp.]|nr:hypothetical protein [Rudaea sp.]